MAEPFIGAEALAAGVMTRHGLRSRCPILPGVFIESAASALLGAKWVNPGVDVDLYYTNTRPPPGVWTHHDRLHGTEHELRRGMAVTTPARTAFDLARRVPARGAGIGPVVAAVDALLNVSRIGVGEVRAVARRHPGVRGVRQADEVLRLVDAGAESPKETWLRLMVRRQGFPPVQTQIEVHDEHGIFVARLDMGWPDLKVAIEYDGDQHRTDRRQYVRDMRRREELDRLGWIVVRVVAEDLEVQIVRRIQTARERAPRFTQGTGNLVKSRR